MRASISFTSPLSFSMLPLRLFSGVLSAMSSPRFAIVAFTSSSRSLTLASSLVRLDTVSDDALYLACASSRRSRSRRYSDVSGSI